MIEVVLRKTADKTMGISSQTQMLKLYDKFSKLTLGFIGCNPFFNMYWFSCFYEVSSIQVLKTVNSVIKVFFFSSVLIKAFVGYLYVYLWRRSNKSTYDVNGNICNDSFHNDLLSSWLD